MPLLIEDCSLLGFLKGKLYADFRNPTRYESELKKVASRLGITSEEGNSSLASPKEKQGFHTRTRRLPPSTLFVGALAVLAVIALTHTYLTLNDRKPKAEDRAKQMPDGDLQFATAVFLSKARAFVASSSRLG